MVSSASLTESLNVSYSRLYLFLYSVLAIEFLIFSQIMANFNNLL